MSLIKNSLKTLLKISPKTSLGVLALTASAYVLIDLFPIQSLGIFKNFEARIVVSLWQSVIWGLYSMALSFFILHSLGLQYGLTNLNFLSFLRKNFLEYITARLRVLILTSLWFLALIVPGFIMSVRYGLTDAFVFFHPDFHSNRNLDPIKLSKNSVGLNRPIFMIFYFLCLFIFPIVIDSVFKHAHFMFEPRGRFFQIILYSFLYLFLNSLIFNTYLDVREESHV